MQEYLFDAARQRVALAKFAEFCHEPLDFSRCPRHPARLGLDQDHRPLRAGRTHSHQRAAEDVGMLIEDGLARNAEHRAVGCLYAMSHPTAEPETALGVQVAYVAHPMPHAIAVGDATLMLQYATYSVISPEGCASILWKSAEHAPEAAESLGITAARLKQLGFVDRVVNEPPGGAHRDPPAMMASLKKALTETLRQLAELPLETLLETRGERLLAYGKFKELGS